MAEFNDSTDSQRGDPLDSLLDQETDEEFGVPDFQEHFADLHTPAVLKDWILRLFTFVFVPT